MFPNPLYSAVLDSLSTQKGIEVHLEHDLVKIEGRHAHFRASTGETIAYEYDFLHILPSRTPPGFLQPIAAANGFVDVDKHTLRHARYGNVFALGDAANLPTIRSAGATLTQAPVVVHNLVRAMDGEPCSASYDGYTTCHIYTGGDKALLIELRYGNEAAETFSRKWQQRPSKLVYQF